MLKLQRFKSTFSDNENLQFILNDPICFKATQHMVFGASEDWIIRALKQLAQKTIRNLRTEFGHTLGHGVTLKASLSRL